MIAGGSFHDDVTTDLVPPLRFNDVPTRRYYDIGIRCARTP
jgi:formylglycine-generating enzyme required for sulfatase activity